MVYLMSVLPAFRRLSDTSFVGRSAGMMQAVLSALCFILVRGTLTWADAGLRPSIYAVNITPNPNYEPLM